MLKPVLDVKVILHPKTSDTTHILQSLRRLSAVQISYDVFSKFSQQKTLSQSLCCLLIMRVGLIGRLLDQPASALGWWTS